MRITILLLFGFLQIYSSENDVLEIQKRTESFLENIAADSKPKDFFLDYCTSNYFFLGGELENTNYNIIESFSIEKIDNYGDSAYIKIKIHRLAVVSLKNFNITDDFIFLEFILKKENSKKWKFHKQINFREFWFLELELIRYISTVFNTYNPYIVSPEHYNYYDIKNRYKEISNYYHNHFSFSLEFLINQNKEKLTILRNEIFAHYGRIFKTKWIKEHFENTIWYSPSTHYSDTLLTENDKKNIGLIKNAEQQIH